MIKNKIIKKAFKLFLAFSMLLGILLQNSNLSLVKAAEVNRVNTKITRFEIKTSDGRPIPSGGEYNYWSQFRLDMDWDASSYGNQLKQGDYFIVKLPDQFKYPTSGAAVDFPLYAPDGRTVIANAHIYSNGEETGGGTVKVTFTNYVENKENVKGNLFLQAGFDHKKIKEGQNNLISVEIGGVKKSVNIKIGTKGTVTNETFAKWGETVSGKDDQVRWVLRVNHTKGNYKNVSISDKLYVQEGTLPPGIHYIKDTFVVHEVIFNSHGSTQSVVKSYRYNEIKDFLHFSDNDTKFTFDYSKKFGDMNGRQYLIQYTSTYIPQLKLRNEGVFHSDSKNVAYQAAFRSAEVGGGGQGDLTQKIKIFKVDENDIQTKLPNAEFLITKVKDGSTFTLKTDAKGEAVSGKLEPGKYKIKETKAPEGYELDPTEKEATVVQGEPLFWTVKNTKVTNINISGTKTWDDANNQDGKRPDKIKVILNKTVDGQTTKVTEKEVTKDNWNYEFNDLPKYENGKEITYSIDEEAVPGYEKEVTGYNLKNSHTPEKVSVAGTKTWDDANNQDGKRPDKIKVILNKTVDGQTTKVTEKEVTKDNWNYEFNDLPKYENGKEITYSIDEEAVPGYEKEVTGYNLKNSHTPEKVNIQGTKTWDDSNNQDGKRPDKIKVILNKTVDGQTTKVTEKEVTKDNWNYEFNDLPKYENGKEITYSIDEEAVPGYEKEVTGYNLKNSHTPEKVSVAGTKTWDDSNNQDGKRPDKIKVILNKTVDGQTTKVTEKEVTKDNWNYEFNDLPKYENGKEITYSIDEEAVPGYEKEVTGYNLKNSHTPEVVNVQGTKTWDDANNQDGKRPDKIKVILNKTVDGQTTKVTEKEVTKDNWNYEFNDLPKYENGKEITYSIDEEAVPGYEKEVTGYNLKNSHTPEKVNIQGTKTWDDSNNQDGKRPDKIKVILNKTVDGQTTKVTEKEVTKDNWNYEFNDLPKYENGKEITYSIDEEAVPGYEKEVTGYNLKNSHTPEKVSVAGTKTWDDSNNQDGKRPDKIKVILNKTVDGQTTKVTEKEVTKDNWNYEFNDLPKYENGKEITYSIDEEAVPGYEKEVTGYNLKNSHTPEVVNVQGTKTWDDANNQDGKRPDKIKVILNKTVDGQTTKVTEKEVTKDNWNYEFNDLPKYENGKEITYSIDEEAVPGYEKEVTGYNLKNSHTPEVVNVQGTKTWDDANNQDGKRPDKIKVILNKTVDGQTTKVTEKEVTKDNWNYEFNDLPKYENGKEITYSIDEEAVPGYEKEVTGYNLKNSHTPEKVSVAGTKTWDDANNQDGKRPDKIKVILNKTVDGQTTKVTEKEVTKDNWNYEFNDLPKYENGKEITYSIDEEAVPGYEKEVTGYNLKNSHTPEVVNVQGTKTWDDANNQDGKRPDKIKVILNKTVDGQTTKVTEKEVTKDNWNYEFNDLPKYENGKEITYSIDEEAVPGYEKEVTGYNLKNSHTPEKVSVAGTKTWDDSNNQDGKRPDKIKVILNKTVDGQTTKVTEKEVTKDNWNYEFNDLPKYENGKEITYSIDEEAVPGYEKEVTGYNLKNSYTPEKVSVAGTKTWDDSNNQDGKRPDKIKVILNKTVDGQTTKVTEKEVTKDNWNYEFNDLPKYENGKEITYSIDEEAVPGYEKEVTGYNLKNSHTPEKVSVAGTKTWDDSNNQDGKRPDKIKVILNKTVDGQTTKVTEKEVTKDNWNYEFNDLPKYENGKEITYSIDEEAVPGYEKEVTGYNLKNSHTPEVVNVQGTKTWDDANNQDGKRPDKIKVILNKTVDGQTTKVTEKEVTKDNWNYEFNDLPKYENGKEITYSIDEEAVPGYEKEVTGYNLKNSHTPEKVNIQGTKTWDDSNNQDGKRPDKIKVILNKTVDGQTTKVTEKEVTKDNWNYEFNDLPKYENGKEITYSIDEEAVPGYEKEVTGYNLKNSHTPEKVSVAGTKTWDDSNNQDGKRPDKIKVILNKTVDGQTTKVTEKEVTKDNWNYEFNDLPKYENGKEITYSIDEEAVPGYEKEVTGYNLKNSHTPEVVNVQGTKTWDDANNQDGKRPDKIKVILNKTVDGQTTKVTEKEVTKDNWNYEFNDLPKYENGKEITYSIDEEAVPGYEKEVTGYNLKNSHTPEVVNVQGTKTWDDANNQDGKRPDKIKVILNKTVDGQTTKVTEKEVTKDNWNYEFNDLPKYENGKEITYSIDEEAVPGYEKEVTGYNLKNSHTPEVVNVQGTKTWDDANNQDGKRPDKIKVILNKTVDGQTTKVTEKEVTKDNWNYEFNDLPKYENGKEITYSIDEEAVPGYEKEVTGYNLKNSHTPEVVNVQGTKTWDDANNQDGKRPDKIKVILNKTVDGQTTKVTEKEVTKDNWNYEFNDLPKYENGKEITYSIDEEAVPGYEKEVTGYNLKNSHTPEKVSVAGTKTWDDANNQDGKRPDKIKVILNKTVDGQTTKVTEKEVTKDNWNYEFNDLPKYENGKEITYSIDEEAVPGYEKEVTGYNLKNSYTPEKVSVAGTKTWDDSNNQDGKRPDKIKVILNKTVDGQTTKVTEKEVTKDNWNYEFNDLPKYENGKEITYSIDEEAVPGYEKSVEGYNLKNTHTPEKVSVAGTKTWDDSNNQDGKRPDKIKVILNKTVDGQTTKVTEKEVTKDNWNYEFNDLPKYENGKEITYSIDEEAVAGYKKTIDGYNLKNTYIPPKPKLPNTGSTSTELGGLGFLAALTGLVLNRRKNKAN